MDLPYIFLLLLLALTGLSVPTPQAKETNISPNPSISNTPLFALGESTTPPTPSTTNDTHTTGIGHCSFNMRVYEECVNGNWRKSGSINSITDGNNNPHSLLQGGLPTTQWYFPNVLTMTYPPGLFGARDGSASLKVGSDLNDGSIALNYGSCWWHEYTGFDCGACVQDDWAPPNPGSKAACGNGRNWNTLDMLYVGLVGFWGWDDCFAWVCELAGIISDS
ncbi:hypothetical protein P280DRAFT_509918 [Massarina eburnea CBS 473.64]|uniref:Cyanovirin-N domain-containing protein n=1 Tax=Massarina eburnea CBS 473.64 TaxID=1395130 RepID=A0A6A6RQE7_9PLEO|nr:hypothetical protein P280DRAFT_509918 [Massarina eburnea CBS 473.64]